MVKHKSIFLILHLSLSLPREECDGAGYLNLRLITTGTLSRLHTHLSGLVCKQVSSFSGIPLLLGLIPWVSLNHELFLGDTLISGFDPQGVS